MATAIELLRQDHQEVINIIEHLQSLGASEANRNSRTEVFNQLKNAITLHSRIEEEVFYPALAHFDHTRDLIENSYKEHQQVDQLLSQLTDQATDWDAQIRELKDSIQHHVQEEEHELFPKAEHLLGQDRLAEMGREVLKVKQSAPTIP